MTGLYTAAQVRAAEQAAMAGLRPGVLMQRAATGLATICLGLLGRASGVRVVLLVGSGDNGGDALFAGAVLATRGAQARHRGLLGRPDLRGGVQPDHGTSSPALVSPVTASPPR